MVACLSLHQNVTFDHHLICHCLNPCLQRFLKVIPLFCTAQHVLRILNWKHWKTSRNLSKMASVRPRDKKGCYRRRKENERREELRFRFKRNAEEPSVIIESDGRQNNEEKGFLLTGRRIVELGVLAKALDTGCQTCGNPLQLSNCSQETTSGLGSFLYITCSNSDCGEINVCLTNKTHWASNNPRGRPIFDVNTKLAAGTCILFISFR